MKYGFPLIVMLFLAGGFFMVLQKLSDIEEMFQNSSLSPASSTLPLGTAVPSERVPVATSTKSEDSGTITIPTAIIFRTLSSPRLEPRTNIAIILESVSKDTNGTLSIGLRTFTSEASSYSALELQSIFEIVDLSSGNNLRASDITGSFNSIPPKSVSPGVIQFRVPPAQRSIILQINTDENPIFYRFFFDQKRYEETTLG
ncbi:MAG: hypothetical protein Q8R20_03340 [Nanoarchaeota archaeon]|nr:hypothetical protein [Nanoarchaeota archaeon]